MDGDIILNDLAKQLLSSDSLIRLTAYQTALTKLKALNLSRRKLQELFANMDGASIVDLLKDIRSENVELASTAATFLSVRLRADAGNGEINSEVKKEIIVTLCDVIMKTSEKTLCQKLMTCLAAQSFGADIVADQLVQILTALDTAQCHKGFSSHAIDLEAVTVLTRLLQQVPSTMESNVVKWAHLVYPLVIHEKTVIRTQAMIAFQLGLRAMKESPTVTKQLVDDLKPNLVNAFLFLMKNRQEIDALTAWSCYVEVLGPLLHRGSAINSLLPVVEMGFKHVNPDIKVAAYKAWKAIIDNFALVPDIISDSKRVKLILKVFLSANVKFESLALEKFQVWWHFVRRLGSRCSMWFEQVVIPLLQFSFRGQFCLPAIDVKPSTPVSKIGSPTSMAATLTNLHSPVSSEASSTPAPYKAVFEKGYEALLMILSVGCDLSEKTNFSSLSIEPLEHAILGKGPQAAKHLQLLISYAKDCIVAGQVRNDAELSLLWSSIVTHVKHLLETSDASLLKQDRQNVLEAMLDVLSIAVSKDLFGAEQVMLLFDGVLTLPSKILGSSAYHIGASAEVMKGCPSLYLIGLLFNLEMLDKFASTKRFLSTVEQVVSIGFTDTTAVLSFCQSYIEMLSKCVLDSAKKSKVVNANNQEHDLKQEEPRPDVVPENKCVRPEESEREALMLDLWSLIAKHLLNSILLSNEVNQGNNFEHNFDCMRSILLFPFTVMNKVSQPFSKNLLKLWTNTYASFIRLAAMVPSAGPNIACEEFCERLLLTLEEMNLEDKGLFDVLCQCAVTISTTADVSEVYSGTSVFGLNNSSSPSFKIASKRKNRPLGNLHSLTNLTDVLLNNSYCLMQTESLSQQSLQSLVQIAETLFSRRPPSSFLVSTLHVLSKSISNLYQLPAAQSKSLTPTTVSKLEKLWSLIVNCVQTGYTGAYDTEFLEILSPLIAVTLSHPRRSIKSQTLKMWNATFGSSGKALDYPADLRDVLSRTKDRSSIVLPGWHWEELTSAGTVDQAAMMDAELSQLDSLTPPVLPQTFKVSPLKLLNTFGKPKSPSVTPKAIKPTNSPRTPSGRKAAKSQRVSLYDDHSEDFVTIPSKPQSTNKILTEHQKEVLKSKSVLPTMYNNLDASSVDYSLSQFQTDSQAESGTVVSTTLEPEAECGKKQNDTELNSTETFKEEPMEDDEKEVGVISDGMDCDPCSPPDNTPHGLTTCEQDADKDILHSLPPLSVGFGMSSQPCTQPTRASELAVGDSDMATDGMSEQEVDSQSEQVTSNQSECVPDSEQDQLAACDIDCSKQLSDDESAKSKHLPGFSKSIPCLTGCTVRLVRLPDSLLSQKSSLEPDKPMVADDDLNKPTDTSRIISLTEESEVLRDADVVTDTLAASRGELDDNITPMFEIKNVTSLLSCDSFETELSEMDGVRQSNDVILVEDSQVPSCVMDRDDKQAEDVESCIKETQEESVNAVADESLEASREGVSSFKLFQDTSLPDSGECNEFQKQDSPGLIDLNLEDPLVTVVPDSCAFESEHESRVCRGTLMESDGPELDMDVEQIITSDVEESETHEGSESILSAGSCHLVISDVESLADLECSTPKQKSVLRIFGELELNAESVVENTDAQISDSLAGCTGDQSSSLLLKSDEEDHLPLSAFVQAQALFVKETEQLMEETKSTEVKKLTRTVDVLQRSELQQTQPDSNSTADKLPLQAQPDDLEENEQLLQTEHVLNTDVPHAVETGAVSKNSVAKESASSDDDVPLKILVARNLNVKKLATEEDKSHPAVENDRDDVQTEFKTKVRTRNRSSRRISRDPLANSISSPETSEILPDSVRRSGRKRRRVNDKSPNEPVAKAAKTIEPVEQIWPETEEVEDSVSIEQEKSLMEEDGQVENEMEKEVETNMENGEEAETTETPVGKTDAEKLDEEANDSFTAIRDPNDERNAVTESTNDESTSLTVAAEKSREQGDVLDSHPQDSADVTEELCKPTLNAAEMDVKNDTADSVTQSSPPAMSAERQRNPDIPLTPTSASGNRAMSRGQLMVQKAKQLFAMPNSGRLRTQQGGAHGSPKSSGLLTASDAERMRQLASGSPLVLQSTIPLHVFSPSASPSAGILRKKRLREDVMSVDSPSPPHKNRRVCFSDKVDTIEIPNRFQQRRLVMSSSENRSSPKQINRQLELTNSLLASTPSTALSGVSQSSLENLSGDANSSTTKGCETKEGERAVEQSSSIDSESGDSGQVLVMTQESQLSCTEPVFPDLANCTEPIDLILPKLTTSTWMTGLRQLLYAKNIKTIGNLSSLSELEVHNLPIVQPKVDNVKESLKVFARTLEKSNKLNSDNNSKRRRMQFGTALEQTGCTPLEDATDVPNKADVPDAAVTRDAADSASENTNINTAEINSSVPTSSLPSATEQSRDDNQAADAGDFVQKKPNEQTHSEQMDTSVGSPLAVKCDVAPSDGTTGEHCLELLKKVREHLQAEPISGEEANLVTKLCVEIAYMCNKSS